MADESLTLNTPPWIIKLGGSVITDKNRPFKVNMSRLRFLIKEIAQIKHPFILLHGGGSFGHPLAKKYNLTLGYQSKEQVIGLGITHEAMVKLNHIIINFMHEAEMPAMSFAPSSLFITEGGRIKKAYLQPVQESLKLGVNPVLFGDVVFDSKTGFSILSGDQLLSFLAAKFNSERLFIGTDTDGIYTGEPKTERNVKLVPSISTANIDSIMAGVTESTSIDVTGGMRTKILELLSIAKPRREIIIFNATVSGRLTKLVRRHSVPCTRII
ncbi:MAG: isopentenyl phosphate kinase [Candidatus Ranarchaeia archaeon]